MAIIKFINNKVGLKKTLNYICKEEKTEKKLVSGKDCLVENAYNEMMAVKREYKKLEGREKIHFIQSFSPKDKITPEQAHEIGLKMAELFKGFQVVVATHIDREHLHNHIVLNTVNFETGLKFHQSKTELQKIKDYSNKLCREYGISVIENKSKIKDIGINEYQAKIKNISWKEQLAKDIDFVMSKSKNKYEFFRGMNNLGYKVNWQKERNTIIYTVPNGYKCSCNKLHKEKYLKENMETYFKEKNRTNIKSYKKNSSHTRYKSMAFSIAEIIKQFQNQENFVEKNRITGMNESAKKQYAMEMHYSLEEIEDMEL